LLAEFLNEHFAGPDNCSPAEFALIKRACTLITECERLEERFAQNGQATLEELHAFQQACNSLRRLLSATGLQRRQRDVTPTVEEYVRHLNEQEGADA
jgi:hypothetical protein